MDALFSSGLALERDQGRQSYDEAGTLSMAFALSTNSAPVKLDQMAYNGQPQSQSGTLTVGTGITLTKAVEHVREELWLNPNAGIAHDYFNVRVDPLQKDLNASILGRELHRVREQIPKDLP